NLRSYVSVLATRMEMEPDQLQTWFNQFTSAWLDDNDADEADDADKVAGGDEVEVAVDATDQAAGSPITSTAGDEAVVVVDNAAVDGVAIDTGWTSSEMLNEQAFDA